MLKGRFQKSNHRNERDKHYMYFIMPGLKLLRWKLWPAEATSWTIRLTVFVLFCLFGLRKDLPFVGASDQNWCFLKVFKFSNKKKGNALCSSGFCYSFVVLGDSFTVVCSWSCFASQPEFPCIILKRLPLHRRNNRNKRPANHAFTSGNRVFSFFLVFLFPK